MTNSKGQNHGFAYFLFYALLPLVLISAIIFRYNFIGVIYLVLLLSWPYNAGIPTAYSKRFSLVVLIFSVFFCILQIIFQIVVFALDEDFERWMNSTIADLPPPTLESEVNCSDRERLLRFLGMQSLKAADHLNRVRIVLPDLIVFAASLACFLVLKQISQPSSHQGSQETQLIPGRPGRTETFIEVTERHLQDMSSDAYLYKVTKVNKVLFLLTLLFLCLSGIASPSLLSFPYLLLFLLLTTLYAFHVDLEPLSSIYKLRIATSVYTGFHLLIIYIYQLQMINEMLESNGETDSEGPSLAARLLGLKVLVTMNCSNPSDLSVKHPVDCSAVEEGIPCCKRPQCWGTEWPDFLEPMFILGLHFVCAYAFKTYHEYRAAHAAHYEQVNASHAAQYAIREVQPLMDDENFSDVDCMSSSTAKDNMSTRSPMSVAARDLHHRMSIFASRLPQRVQITTALREKALYVFGLIMMMAWSVTYHSWITFILLLWSCYLWMARDRATVTLRHSKYITLYAIILILLQFVYSLRLTDQELPVKLNNGNDLKTIGLRRPESHAFLTLLLEIGFTLVFWLMIHEFIRKKFDQRRPSSQQPDLPPMPEVQAWILEQLARYFIIIVSGFLLFIALNGDVVGYKIIYMVFFLFSGIIFQLSWNLWHRILRVFWLLLVVYSILVVVLIYTFQLKGFSNYWNEITKLKADQLKDIGLTAYTESSTLMMKIFMPTAFLVCCMLQLHYYHERFVLLVDENTEDFHERAVLSKEERHHRTDMRGNINDGNKTSRRFQQIWAKLSAFGETFKRIAWKLLEIHRWKICAITVIISALYQPSACYLFPALIWILSLPFRQLDLFVYIVTLVWSAMMLLMSMIYQLSFVHKSFSNATINQCNNTSNNPNTADTLEWFGFRRVPDDESFCYFVRGWLAIIITLLAERVIFRRSRYLENMYPESKNAPGAVFPEITRENADESVKACAQFFINYFFHKFGVEICFVSTVLTVWKRQDVFGSVYAILLLILLFISFKSRASLSRFWKPYTLLLAVIWALEYVLVLGVPQSLCLNWTELWQTALGGGGEDGEAAMIDTSTPEGKEQLTRFITFMFLPQGSNDSGIDQAKALRIVPDFFQLLLAVCQCSVFENEKKAEWIKLAGSNDDENLDNVKDNPYRNFILAEPPTTLDRLKTFVFSMVYWVTFTVVLIAGTNRTSLFCLGYLVASFYFLYQGQVIITSRPSILRRRWNLLLFFTGFVIVAKCCLQLLACVFHDFLQGNDESKCIIVSLLSLSCENSDQYQSSKDSSASLDSIGRCISEKDKGSVGIFWDFTTFIFLLLQRRIFQSYYFLHVREDLIVQIGLSSKGNQLFSMWVLQEAKKRNHEEELDRKRVGESVERIKKNVKGDLQEPYDHFDALRVCDKSWFEGLTETIETGADTKSSQINHRPSKFDEADVEALQVDAYAHPTIPHSYTDNQINNKHGQSPKLPKGIRDMTHNLGNLVFTGRLPDRERKELYDSHETLPTEPKPAGMEGEIEIHVPEEVVLVDPEDEVEKRQGCGGCMGNLVVDLLIYLTRVLNTRTQAYRSIIIQLKKDRQESRKGMPVVAPRKYAVEIKREALKQSFQPNKSSPPSGSGEDLRINTEDRKSKEDVEGVKGVEFISPDDFDKGEHYLQRLLSAIWYFGQFQIDNVCYTLMVLNGMLNASLLSIPYLGFVFLWAMLSVPRPSKRFWVTAIGYTCVVIIVKYVFAFQFWTANSWIRQSDPDHPFNPTKIVGLTSRPSVKYIDIAQLLVLFFQRGLLKVHGLWENYDEFEFNSDNDIRPIENQVNNTINYISGRFGGRGHRDFDADSAAKNKQQNCCVRGADWLIRQMVILLRSPGRFYARVIELEKDRKNTPTDMYIWMLGVDFICFIIIMFGYWAFGKHTIGQQGDITTEIKENTVPKSFLYLLIIHFFLILIDRAIYLKKNLIAKLVFHVMQVLVIHIWMFFLLPSITVRSFYKNNVAMALYTFKALYFAFSSHQIKCGYPTRILQHFLTKKYNYVNLYVFIGYRICPFIIEFQNIMDWMFVESTVGISRWFMLTTIYHELYQIKCWRVLEKQFHYPRGEPRWPSFKYSGGGILIILLIIIMWFPLAFMSIVQTVAGVPNAPKELIVSVTINGYSDFYTDFSAGDQLQGWEAKENRHKYEELMTKFEANQGALQFLSRYDAGDIYEAELNQDSDSLWMITGPQRDKLLKLLTQNASDNKCLAEMLVKYKVRRKASQYKKQYEYASGMNVVQLNSTQCSDLRRIIANPYDDTNVTIYDALPQYIRALTTDDARPIASMMSETDAVNATIARMARMASIELSLNSTMTKDCYCEMPNDDFRMINCDGQCEANENRKEHRTKLQWWQVKTKPSNGAETKLNSKIIIISDKTGPESLSWLTGYGVIGLYLSVVLLCGRYTRAIFQYDGSYILFHEYPNVDDMIQLCLDIYLVREMKLWKLEEDLMAKLIYLYRSPETMLRYTKLRPYKPKLKQLKQD